MAVLGVEKQVSYAFEQNGKYFVASANEIASGFLSPEQNIVSLFDKLNQMQTDINSLRALIQNAKGKLVVRIIDDLGQEYQVEPNSTVKLFAGNYKDEVDQLIIRKGAIITKNYFVKIFNDAASDLELYSRYFGPYTTKAYDSVISGSSYQSNDTDYNTLRRYDYVPLGLSNASQIDITTYGFIRNLPEASSQSQGQFINSRYTSINGKSNLYGAVNGATHGVFQVEPQLLGAVPSLATSLSDIEYICGATDMSNISVLGALGSTSSGDFIRKGSNTAGTKQVIPSTDAYVTQAFNNNSILVHINHPEISNRLTNVNPNLTASSEVRNSRFSIIQTGATGYNQQNALFYLNSGNPTDSYTKIAFEANDRYLLGTKSCGAYLFMNPSEYSSIRVKGDDAISTNIIKFGSNNGISIPLTFQYRMTDYWGDGDTGLGNISGDINSNSSTNISYTKTIGIDIFNDIVNKDKFSFDVEVTARYSSKTITSKGIPTRTFESALDDLNNTVKTNIPTTSRDV